MAQLQSTKEQREEELATPWSYEPLSTEQLRWYWIKQPFSLKGRCLASCDCMARSLAAPAQSENCRQ